MSKDMRIQGASNINPCPECNFPWFAVVRAGEKTWTVVCRNCNTEYIKPVATAEVVPNVDPIRGY